jgi:hypothetical protein
MTDDLSKVSCAEFQAHLPELVAAGGNLADHEHVQSCDLCRALLADLETIAEAARQLFPSVEPPDKLWAKIESAIKSGDEHDSKGDLTTGLTAQPE